MRSSFFTLLRISTIICFLFDSKVCLSQEEVPIIDVIITVKTDWSIISKCIDSLVRCQPNVRYLQQRIIMVDDGSPSETLKYEKKLCEKDPHMFFCVATSGSQQGYTWAVKIGTELGLRLGIRVSSSIVLLNSDTIVTNGWLESLHNALFFSGDDKLRIVGPLSNAASFQSVPDLRIRDENGRETGGWSTNVFPYGLDVETMGREVRNFVSTNNVSTVPLMILNGFCFMFKRELLDEIGNFDVKTFPKGYGEEVDFSIRTHKAGFSAHIVPDSYVFHKKTSSFSESSKTELKKSSRKALEAKYGVTLFGQFDQEASRLTGLDSVRTHLHSFYEQFRERFPRVRNGGSILFVLHDLAVAGGIVSVLQEAYQMYKFGVNVSLSVPFSSAGGNPGRVMRAMLPGISDETVSKLLLRHEGLITFPHEVSEEFISYAKDFDILVATHCHTVQGVTAVTDAHPHILPAYYVQDYEPWFWHSPFEPKKDPSIPEAVFARNSYQVKDMYMISKTHWTAYMVRSHHNVTVHRVIPSMDHTIFYPNHTLLDDKFQKTWDKDKFNVVAMVRPRTARRNPVNTIEVLLRLAYSFPNSVQVTIFGCDQQSFNQALLGITQHSTPAAHRKVSLLERPNIKILGVLYQRATIADLLRQSDLFVDLSWWQAFGRSALEAMACGSVAVMPLTGAAPEICGKGEEANCLYHDGNDPAGFYQEMVRVLQDDELRYRLIRRGMDKTRLFSIEGAAASMSDELQKGLISHRERHPLPVGERGQSMSGSRRRLRKRDSVEL